MEFGFDRISMHAGYDCGVRKRLPMERLLVLTSDVFILLFGFTVSWNPNTG